MNNEISVGALLNLVVLGTLEVDSLVVLVNTVHIANVVQLISISHECRCHEFLFTFHHWNINGFSHE